MVQRMIHIFGNVCRFPFCMNRNNLPRNRINDMRSISVLLEQSGQDLTSLILNETILGGYYA